MDPTEDMIPPPGNPAIVDDKLLDSITSEVIAEARRDP